MSKELEPGLEHIKKLNIRSFRDSNNIYSEFSKKFGKNKAQEILDQLLEASYTDQETMYAKKNADYDLAMTFSGGYDADIVRQSVNWIYEHSNQFNDDILEIGCDCGFMTTFLGSLLPDKHITAIDRIASGIEIAKKNVEKFNLNNINFQCIDAMNITDITYNTVFSMRTMHENGIDDEEDAYNELSVQADIYTKSKQKYANKLSSLVKPGGKLICIERVYIDALFLAWLQALANAGMRLISHQTIECLEVGNKKEFQGMVFVKDTSNTINAYSSFRDCFMKRFDEAATLYKGWDAKILYEFDGGDLIEGYNISDKITGIKGKLVVCNHKDEDDCILYYSNINGDTCLEYYDSAEKDALIKVMKNDIEDLSNQEGLDVSKML